MIYLVSRRGRSINELGGIYSDPEVAKEMARAFICAEIDDYHTWRVEAAEVDTITAPKVPASMYHTPSNGIIRILGSWHRFDTTKGTEIKWADH